MNFPEDILRPIICHLPLALSVWSGILFAWGIFLTAALTGFNAQVADRNPVDSRCICVLWGANIFLAAGLFLFPSTFQAVADLAVVINAFITSIFTAYTVNVSKIIKETDFSLKLSFGPLNT